MIIIRLPTYIYIPPQCVTLKEYPTVLHTLGDNQHHDTRVCHCFATLCVYTVGTACSIRRLLHSLMASSIQCILLQLCKLRFCGMLRNIMLSPIMCKLCREPNVGFFLYIHNCTYMCTYIHTYMCTCIRI